MNKIGFLVFGFLIVFFQYCKGGVDSNDLTFSVTFLKGEAERVISPAKLKVFDSIPVSEVVKTEKESVLDLASSLGTMRMLGNTSVNLSQLTQDHVELNVTEGNILVKAYPLKKGQSLKVATPTVVAAVRGTEFWGQVNKESETGTFAVRDGSVEITRKVDGASILIEKGQALDIDPRVKTWKIREAKQGELDAMSQIDEIK